MIYLLLLVGGLALVAWNTWQHLGRSPASRAWARSVQGGLKVRSVLVVRPLLAIVLLLAAATGATDGASGATIAIGLGLGLALLVLIGYLVLPIPVPRFAQPGWFQRLPTSRAATRA